MTQKCGYGFASPWGKRYPPKCRRRSGCNLGLVMMFTHTDEELHDSFTSYSQTHGLFLGHKYTAAPKSSGAETAHVSRVRQRPDSCLSKLAFGIAKKKKNDIPSSHGIPRVPLK